MRILLADDHAVVLRGLQMVLSMEQDLTIVGEVSTGEAAVQLVKQLAPDLVLMDLKMPGLGGAGATKLIKMARPQTRVLILTGVDINEEIERALEAGADGYVLKQVAPDELIRAIRIVGAGEAYLQPAVTKRLIQKLHVAANRSEEHEHPSLTTRECEVLRLMATSATYREIAARLFVGEETVRSHAKSILAKLDQPNRTQAVLVALKEGLIHLD